MQYYVVDSFTNHVFGGGPAGVVIADSWPSDELMQNISMENNLADTAFIVKTGNDYEIRWFMPNGEINLNGHATLAAAFCLFNFIEPEQEVFTFRYKNGELHITREDDLIVLEMPAVFNNQIKITDEIVEALGSSPSEAYFGENLFCVFKSVSEIRDLKPNFDKMKALQFGKGVFISAVNDGGGSDIVCRAFWPKMGINENPVCGNMHCNLTPFWCNRLGKREIISCQLSKRGAIVIYEDLGERVKLKGKAVLFLKTELNI